MTEQEKRINRVNIRYRKERKAVIQKIEVPILMTNIGLVPQQSTVDYIGVYNYRALKGLRTGRGIAFDAKETQGKTSFPLSNIKSHQLLFLDYWKSIGGLAFFLIQFKTIYPNDAFVTPIDFVHTYWDNPTGRKSIPIKDFDQRWLVKLDDYLTKYL